MRETGNERSWVPMASNHPTPGTEAGTWRDRHARAPARWGHTTRTAASRSALGEPQDHQEALGRGGVEGRTHERGLGQGVRIGFDRSDRVGPGKRSPVSVGVGGSTGSYGSGVGLGLGINLGGGPRQMQDLQLTVRLDDAATGRALWEGRAISAVPVKAPAAQPSLAAAKLAAALFKDFPGESGRTISVP